MPEVPQFFSLLQRILDPEAGKSREVAVIGAKRRAMFDGKSSHVRIHD